MQKTKHFEWNSLVFPIAGHAPQCTIFYTKYGKTPSNTNIQKDINDFWLVLALFRQNANLISTQSHFCDFTHQRLLHDWLLENEFPF